MNRKDMVNFAPQGISNKKRFPFYVILIVIAVLLVGALSCTVILAKNDFDIKKALGIKVSENTTSADENEQDSASSEVLTETESKSYNFLAVCANGKDIDFMQVISVDPAVKKFTVHPVSPDMTVENAENVQTVKDLYARGGVNDVIAAFESNALPIARYVIINEENFVSLIQALGAVDMTLEKDFSFTGDELKYTFDAGRISMNADALLQYMKFVSVGDELLRLQGEATAAIIRTHFTFENVSQGEDKFSRIINLVKTDINAFDYTAAIGIINDMASAGITVNVEN